MERRLPQNSRIHILKRLYRVFSESSYAALLPEQDRRAMWLAMAWAVLEQPVYFYPQGDER